MTGRWLLTAALGCACLAAQVKLPPYTRQMLPNGVVVDLMPKPGVPLVGFRVLVKGGTEAEPANLAGLASVTAQLLRKGTSKRTADQFSEELDFLGGTFQTFDAQESATQVSAEFLKKDFDQGLDLLTDALLRPTFREAEVRKTLSQREDSIKALKDNPRAAIGSYFEAFFFGPNHPYGRPPDEQTLSRIQRQNIVDFHSRIYRGRNIIVIVTGEFDSTSAMQKIKDAFGGVAPGDAFDWPKAPPLSAGGKLLLVDKPDATQTYFYIGEPGIDRKNPDRVKLMLINTLFGGRFTSMLNEALRVKTGLSYGASSQLQQTRLPGAILLSTFTKTDTTEKAIDLSLETLKQLRETGITAEQLASVKAYVKGTFPSQRLETSDQLAGVLGDIELFGLNRGEVDDFFSAIDAVSLSDANAAVKKYFKTDDLTFVVLGNAAKIRESLGKYARNVTEVPVNKPGFTP